MRSACLVLAVGLLAAGEAAPTTLADCLRRAAAGDETTRIAQARILAARSVRDEARAALRGDLDAQASLTSRREAGESVAGSLTAKVDLVAPASWSDLSAATARLRAVGLESGELERDLAFAVAQAFVDVLAAEGVAAAARRRLSAADEALRAARVNAAAGLATRSDVSRIEVEQAGAAAAQAAADADALISRHRLAFLVNDRIDGPLTPPAPPPDAARPVEDLRAEALSLRRDLLALAERSTAAGHDLRAVRAGHLPRLSLRADLGETHDLAGDGPTDDELAASAALVLDWSLWDGGARLARTDRARAAGREADLVRVRALRRLDLDLAQALADLARARAVLVTGETRERAAADHAAEVAGRFRAGLATVIEQTDATATTFEAAADLARSRSGLQSAWFGLQRTLGRLPDGSEPTP